MLTVAFLYRMTVIASKWPAWCHSPIQPNQALFDQLTLWDQLHTFVSPNKIHYAYIADWKKRYPKITWSSPGVEERAVKQKIPVSFDEKLTDKAPQAWEDQINQLVFKGSKGMEEVVKDSQTLILTDLIGEF